MTETSISRRTALAAGLTGAGALALAACSSNSGGADTPTTSAAQKDPVGTTPTTAAPGTTAAGTTPATSGASSASASGLASLDSITVGQAVSAKLNGKPVLVARPTATTAACFSAICTHEGCTVLPAGAQLHCPCHNSIYDAKTGAVISGPAPRALDTVKVKVESGEVVADA